MPGPVIPFEYPYKPELLPEVQEKIVDILGDGGEVFEFGSGHSTLWFAMIPACIVSVEHDEDWFHALGQEMIKNGIQATVLYARKDQIPYAIDDYGKFDLILVDCADWQRIEACDRSRHHLKEGGYLVIDDSHWPIFKPVHKMLENWQRFDMSGMHRRKNGIVRYHQTSFYQRNHV